MKSKDLQTLTILLAILLITTNSITDNEYLYVLSMAGIIYILVWWMMKSPYKAVPVAAAILVVLYLAKCSMPVLERFEATPEPEAPEPEAPEPEAPEPEAEESPNKKAAKDLESLLERIKEREEKDGKEVKINMEEDFNTLDLTEEAPKDSKYFNEKDAQRETFELINSVQQLRDTVKTLQPYLVEGKKVMKLFKDIKV